jgi:hypothetical protein
MNDGVSNDGPSGGPAYRRSSWMLMIALPVVLLFSTALLLSGCGQDQASAGAHATDAAVRAAGQTAGQAATLPAGVMPAARACKLVVGKPGNGFFTDPKQVHLVLTSYAKGEPVESRGDISTGMPAQTLVWVVEVHAKAVNWDHGGPPGYKPGPPDTDFSVVMNAKTGSVSDQGECNCWPLPLSTVGSVVSLPPTC